MKLPTPAGTYDVRDQSELRRSLELEDNRNRKRDQDIELGQNRVILTSPNGSRYALTVNDAGVLGATLVG